MGDDSIANADTGQRRSLANPVAEGAAARANRLTEKLRGLLKTELAEYGGAEGLLRSVRSDDEHRSA